MYQDRSATGSPHYLDMPSVSKRGGIMNIWQKYVLSSSVNSVVLSRVAGWADAQNAVHGIVWLSN